MRSSRRTIGSIEACMGSGFTDKEEKGMKLLGDGVKKITVMDERTEKEIAVITEEEIITAEEHIVVKIIPRCD